MKLSVFMVTIRSIYRTIYYYSFFEENTRPWSGVLAIYCITLFRWNGSLRRFLTLLGSLETRPPGGCWGAELFQDTISSTKKIFVFLGLYQRVFTFLFQSILLFVASHLHIITFTMRTEIFDCFLILLWPLIFMIVFTFPPTLQTL